MEFQALSLFNTEQPRIEVKKHSSLIQMTNQITLTQRKSVSVCICVAKEILKAQPDARVFTIDIGKFKRLAGIRSNNNAEVKQALRGLVSAKIEYNIFGKDKQSVWGAFNFLSHVKIIEEGAGRPSYVQFEFPSNVLEAVRHPSMYARLDMLILRWLNSKYAVAIYELMKDYAGIGTYSMSIEQFRHRMGLEAGEYTVVTMLRKRIIDKAVDEINNKTDIRVEYDLIKTGKSFSHIAG